jgi:hypothetical protein
VDGVAVKGARSRGQGEGVVGLGWQLCVGGVWSASAVWGGGAEGEGGGGGEKGEGAVRVGERGGEGRGKGNVYG